MKIIFYSKTGCPWCEEVKELLDEKQVLYEERNVIENPAFYDELVKKSNQGKTPTLDIEGEIIADTDAKAVTAYMKARGIKGF